MQMAALKDKHKISEYKVESLYLPSSHGFFKEKLLHKRFEATYWIWKRMIHRHDGKINDIEQSTRFLDVGCGPGNFICCLEKWFQNADITGLDIEPGLLQYAADRTANAHLLQGDAEALPFENNTFHVVSCLQVIEHLSKPEKFFSEANRVLKEGGILLLATPNPQGLAARLLGESWIGIRDYHISLRSPAYWHKTLEKTGFEILNDGTTLFNGVPLIGRFPFCLPFQLLQTLFGWFYWHLGSSYMAIAKKR